jgi:hypothetical protein
MDFYQILTGQNVKRPIWALNSSYILSVNMKRFRSDRETG